MARTVFFSFHYQTDIFRVNQIRNLGIVVGQAAAGFRDGSLWEEAKLKGNGALQRLIDNGLKGTSVTVVLIGENTSKREWVDYEIKQSIERGNGLLGIYIHNMKGIDGAYGRQGYVPERLLNERTPCYEWNKDRFGEWVEQAFNRSRNKGLW